MRSLWRAPCNPVLTFPPLSGPQAQHLSAPAPLMLMPRPCLGPRVTWGGQGCSANKPEIQNPRPSSAPTRTSGQDTFYFVSEPQLENGHSSSTYPAFIMDMWPGPQMPFETRFVQSGSKGLPLEQDSLGLSPHPSSCVTAGRFV